MIAAWPVGGVGLCCCPGRAAHNYGLQLCRPRGDRVPPRRSAVGATGFRCVKSSVQFCSKCFCTPRMLCALGLLGWW